MRDDESVDKTAKEADKQHSTTLFIVHTYNSRETHTVHRQTL